MADPGEDDGSRERKGPHRPAHQAERDDAVEDTVGVDRHQHAAHGGIEHVRHEHHQHDRPDERRAPQKRVALSELCEVAPGSLVAVGAGAGTSARTSRAETREGGRVHDQDVRRPENCDQDAGER